MSLLRYLLIPAFALLVQPANADIAGTDRTGDITIFAFTCFSTKVCPSQVPVTSAGVELFTSSSAGYVRAASGGFASGSIASGAVASGAIASGAVASGALAVGAGADGWDVTKGAKADSVCGSDTGTCGIVALLKKIAANTTTVNTSVGAGTIATGTLGVPAADYISTNSNIGYINGVALLAGAGNTGTGSPRVTIATDQAALAGMGVGATGAAAPANANYMGALGSGATGGLTRGLITCDQRAWYSGSDNGSKTLIAGVSGRKTYICGYLLQTSTTATTLTLYKGTDADCATSGAAIGPPYALVANDKVGANSAFWNGFVTATAADYVCINAGAGNPHTAEIWYTIL